MFSLQFHPLLLDICPPSGRESYTEHTSVPCAGLVGKPLRWHVRGTSWLMKPDGAALRKGDAKQLAALNSPGIGPSIFCSQRVRQKHVLLNPPGSKGRGFMEREEITSSSEFILYDRAYLEATSLCGGKTRGDSLSSYPPSQASPWQPSRGQAHLYTALLRGSRKSWNQDSQQSTLDWFPVSEQTQTTMYFHKGLNIFTLNGRSQRQLRSWRSCNLCMQRRRPGEVQTACCSRSAGTAGVGGNKKSRKQPWFWQFLIPKALTYFAILREFKQKWGGGWKTYNEMLQQEGETTWSFAVHLRLKSQPCGLESQFSGGDWLATGISDKAEYEQNYSRLHN